MPESLQAFKAGLFKALASPVRIRMLEELRSSELTVGELQERLGLDSSNASQHLSVLRAQSLVVNRREGNNVRYAVEEPRIYDILDAARGIFENQVNAGARLLRQATTHEQQGRRQTE
jgi:ArsR family transcriptional regulator